jgi:hypothetical protein
MEKEEEEGEERGMGRRRKRRKKQAENSNTMGQFQRRSMGINGVVERAKEQSRRNR